MEKKKNIILENINNEFLFYENKSNLNILFNRIAFIFFCFIFLCIIYLIQTFHLINKEIKKSINFSSVSLNNHRADIVDFKGQILAKTLLLKNRLRIMIPNNFFMIQDYQIMNQESKI